MTALLITGTLTVQWAPGNMVVSVANGAASAAATVEIDDVPTGQAFSLEADGTKSNVSIIFGPLAVGAHQLTISTSSQTGTVPFQVERSATTAGVPSAPPTPTPQQQPLTWQFEDPVTSEVYVLPVNPDTASAPFGPRSVADRVTTSGQPISTEGNQKSSTWNLEGYVRNQTELDAFVFWAKKPHRIYITDDLGRTLVSLITSFVARPVPPQRSSGINALGRYEMTVEVGLT